MVLLASGRDTQKATTLPLCWTPMGTTLKPCAEHSLAESPNNPLQRSGHDKVHAPDRRAGSGLSGSAPQVRRAAAERGR